jgi:hypothetical protein
VKLRTPQKPVCVICGSADRLEDNHTGGRNHIPWFRPPFCQRHHQQFHRTLEGLEIDLQYTPDKLKRLVFAALAMTIALWMVLQALAEEVLLHPEKSK